MRQYLRRRFNDADRQTVNHDQQEHKQLTMWELSNRNWNRTHPTGNEGVEPRANLAFYMTFCREAVTPHKHWVLESVNSEDSECMYDITHNQCDGHIYVQFRMSTANFDSPPLFVIYYVCCSRIGAQPGHIQLTL